MIHQCYFDASQKAKLFPTPAYRGFGLYGSVNPDIAANCPELVEPAMQAQLSEYAAMLHMWRNPHLDDDSWIGFTSYRQLDKFSTIFRDKKEVHDLLAQYDVVGWGCYAFVDGATHAPLSIADASEKLHAGMTACIWRLMSLHGQTVPIGYLTGRAGLFCNYWAMSKEQFNEYMRWSYPLVKECIERPDAYVQSHPRSLAYLLERLFICWYLTHQKQIHNVGPMVTLSVHTQSSRAAQGDDGYLGLPSWHMTLSELCRHHRVAPKGIVHVGAHWAEERESYRQLGVSNVIWIEADPANMPQLQANVAPYPGNRAIQACLANSDDSTVSFFRTNNRGESSSILPMAVHRQVHPEIQVVEQTSLQTTTFSKLAEREGISLDQYDFLVVDVQGAELLALKGFGECLKEFSGVYLEVNLEQLYEGCALLPDVDAFFAQLGFERRETLMTDKKYGDALYLRKSVHSPASPQVSQLANRARRQVELTRSYAYFLQSQGSRFMELIHDGSIREGIGMYEQRWQVRACGHDVVLEMIGQVGRSCVLETQGDGIWRGSSLLFLNTSAQLVPYSKASQSGTTT